MNFSEKLVYVRAKLGYSQEQLAKVLNVSFATINRWEQGHTKPSKRYIVLFESYCAEQSIVFPEKHSIRQKGR